MAGIQTMEIGLRPMVRTLRTVGVVSYDQSRQAQIVSRIGGYVEKLLVDRTFVQVREGQPLAEIYSPELVAAIQELKVAATIPGSNLPRLARNKIRLLGIEDAEIDALLRSSDDAHRVVVRAPAAGFVIQKMVQQGSTVTAGQMLFEVADLSNVWIEADVYERDLGLLQPDQALEATVEAYPGRVFQGRVSLVYPELNTATRTNRVRFDVANEQLLLRAGMYASVLLETPVQETEPFQSMLVSASAPPADPAAAIAKQSICPVTGARLGSMGEPLATRADNQILYLCCAGCDRAVQREPQKYLARIRTVTPSGVLSVPESAVIDTGDQKIVYVERDDGVFEGVEVSLGPKSGGFYAVVSGLLPGDRIAAAGAFLIDAETRLNPAASASYFGASSSPSAGSTSSAAGAASSAAGPASGGVGPASGGGSVSGAELGGAGTGAVKANSPPANLTERDRSAARNNVGTSSAVEAPQPRDAALNFATSRLNAEELAEIAKLDVAEQMLARTQVLCPVTLEPLGSMGKPVKVIVQNEEVMICCKGCANRIQRLADKMLEMVRRWREANAGESEGSQP
jgi:membrane fusion protein, copper/silver efflux system